MAECVVYWLYDKNCKNIETDGYVGISEDHRRRLMEHRSSGQFSNVFCMDIIFTGSRAECIAKEIELRPTALIGWNNAPGGQTTPRRYGKMPRATCENCGIETSIQLYKRYHGKQCGKPISEKEYQNRCRAQKGNTLGRIVSEETKEKTRVAMLGKKFGPCSEERKRNISKAKKGISIKQPPSSPERKAWFVQHNRKIAEKRWAEKRTRFNLLIERWNKIYG